MKKMRILAVLLVLAMVLGGCATSVPVETTVPATTAAPTEAPEVKEVFTWEDMQGIDHTEKNLNFNKVKMIVALCQR